MPVYPYQFADGSTRWYYIVDLPASTEGRRRQRKKRGFASQQAAGRIPVIVATRRPDEWPW